MGFSTLKRATNTTGNVKSEDRSATTTDGHYYEPSTSQTLSGSNANQIKQPGTGTQKGRTYRRSYRYGALIVPSSPKVDRHSSGPERSSISVNVKRPRKRWTYLKEKPLPPLPVSTGHSVESLPLTQTTGRVGPRGTIGRWRRFVPGWLYLLSSRIIRPDTSYARPWRELDQIDSTSETQLIIISNAVSQAEVPQRGWELLKTIAPKTPSSTRRSYYTASCDGTVVHLARNGDSYAIIKSICPGEADFACLEKPDPTVKRKGKYRVERKDPPVYINEIKILKRIGRLEHQGSRRQVTPYVLRPAMQPGSGDFFWASEYGYLHVALDWCPHGDLLRNMKLINDEKLPLVAAQVASGLCWLHENGVVHHDLKLENILIDWRGNCVIGDLGGSRLIKEDTPFLSHDEGVVYTPEYAAPELLSRREVRYTQAIDWWSLGICLLRLKIKSDLPSRNFKHILRNEDFSNSLRNFLRNLLRKNPFKRLQGPQVLLHPYLQSINRVDLANGNCPVILTDLPALPAWPDIDRKHVVDEGEAPFLCAKYAVEDLKILFRTQGLSVSVRRTLIPEVVHQFQKWYRIESMYALAARDHQDLPSRSSFMEKRASMLRRRD